MVRLPKRKNKNTDVHDDSSDIFPIAEHIDGTSDYSNGSFIHLGYDEFEDGQFDEKDYLGISDNEEGNKQEESSRSPFRMIVMGATVLIVALIAWSLLGKSDDAGTQQNNDQNQSQTNSRIEGDNEGSVINEELGRAYQGNDNGNPINGTGAILAFDYAYYTDRDGEKARSMFNPDTDAYSGSYIQQEINKVPQGTTYDLTIQPERIGEVYDVELSLSIPGLEPTKYNQKFYTMEKDGKFYVEKFTSQIGDASSS